MSSQELHDGWNILDEKLHKWVLLTGPNDSILTGDVILLSHLSLFLWSVKELPHIQSRLWGQNRITHTAAGPTHVDCGH